ncbi:MAG: hypothetical protein ACT4TC_19105 [Myxococcaceae bacterium]
MSAPVQLDLSLDPSFAPRTIEAIAQVFSEANATVRFTERATLRLVNGLERLENDGRIQIVLEPGALESAHAAVLRTTPAGMVLATRENGLPSVWETSCLVALLTGAPPSSVQPALHLTLRRTFGIQAAAHEAAQTVRAAGGGNYAAACAADVMHEIAANALLVAPVTSDGTPKYALQRDAKLDIPVDDACEVSLWVANDRVFLSALDRFGRLGTAPIASAIAGLGKRARVDVSGGGAGLGLRRIVEHSDLVAIRVHPGRQCEVTCAVELAENRRRAGNPKSLMYLVSRGHV